MLSDRIRANRKFEITPSLLRNKRAPMYPEKAYHATSRRIALCLFELCVPFDKFLRAASGKADGDAAVFVVAFNSDDGSDAKAGVTDFATQHGIGIAAALGGGAAERTLSGRRAARGGCCLLWSSTHTAQEFFWRIRILRVGLVAASLANFRHRTSYLSLIHI